jgi:flavin reductase (DIM6/NTAB) family NADH-FMN oxidoreductase RutF
MLLDLQRKAGTSTFKQGMRALAAGVTVIASQDELGVYLGVTATAVTSLSAEPPSLLVCLNRATAMAETLRPNGAFSVNVLSDEQVDVAQAFGGQRGVRGMGRFAYGSWYRSTGDVPLLAGACVSFECTVAEIMDWATHRVVVGQVCDVHFAAASSRPLVYHEGRYTTVE